MARFPYVSVDNLPATLMPRLPITLALGNNSLEVIGLLDTGAAINVLPYSVGVTIGANWESQTTVVPLSGNLANVESRAIVLLASNPEITLNHSIRLAFAWVQTDNVPVLFGQMNFFLEFDVCFYRSQSVFDVRLKTMNGRSH